MERNDKTRSKPKTRQNKIRILPFYSTLLPRFDSLYFPALVHEERCFPTIRLVMELSFKSTIANSRPTMIADNTRTSDTFSRSRKIAGSIDKFHFLSRGSVYVPTLRNLGKVPKRSGKLHYRRKIILRFACFYSGLSGITESDKDTTKKKTAGSRKREMGFHRRIATRW